MLRKTHFSAFHSYGYLRYPKKSSALNRQLACAGWLTGVKRNRRGTFHDAMMQTDCTQVFSFPPAPKGHNKIAQGKAKRRPERVFFSNRSMALRGRACHLTNRTANGSKTHFTGREAFLIQSEPKRSLLGGLVKSPNRWRWLAHRG